MFYFLKKNYILLFTSFFVGAFFLLIYSLSEVAGYTPISPLPGLESIDTGNPSGLIQYFNRIFVIFISIVAVLGVIKLMICGFQYMTSEAISSKEEAKKCMTGVFGGLFLVLISVLVLQTINPSLIKLTFFDTLQQRIGAVEFSIPDFDVDATSDGSRGRWCYDHTTNPGTTGPSVTQQQCFGTNTDSLACEKSRRSVLTLPNFVSATPCYRLDPGG